MILLDTHVMLWLRLGDARLGAGARSAIDRAWQSDEVCVSAVSFWEAALLKAKQRIQFPEDVGLWRREQLEQGVVEIPMNGVIGIRAATLPEFHADPADRLIVATALEGHRLVTADRRILEWSGQVSRLNATQ
ncbi:MAG: type II toxin-antitoxin system VapC family toxin [Chloroflexi bacterium]|nr:type II toxin-antitoxin system VapC family toxin [Chloroflexota bacterium]